MKLYLSSYRLGGEGEKLREMAPGKGIGYIGNAFDFVGVDPEKRAEHVGHNVASLGELGFEVEVLDLREYFGKEEVLAEKVKSLGSIFVSGGNTFVLRQAFALSGLDEILRSLRGTDFCYGGYSAGGCVLSERMDCYAIVDKADDFPYPEIGETIWEGVGLIDFAFMPHYQSDHPESAEVGKEVAYCQKHGIPYKTLRDGEVMILEI